MQAHIDNTRRKLGELASLSEKTESAERKILEHATKQLDQVDDDIVKARAAANADPSQAQKYMDMVSERGRLMQVIAKSRSILRDNHTSAR